FISIFIAIFVTGEFTHGTMKNVVSKGFDKISIYLSKVISMIAATYIMIFVTFIFSFFTATIISGKFGTLTASYFGEIIRMVGIELLLFAALASSFVMISMLVRNIGGVIAINIIGILSFLPMIYQLLELLFKNKIHFTYYELQFNMNIYNTNLSPSLEDIIRSIIVGVAYLAVTTLIGVYFFKKSDIK
ncbi:MAG TPA: ABC transporter permease subunit, partial [Mobilitalea sp.]|nr:ABC transporter permease subunit [Mobilitalea sp.]